MWGLSLRCCVSLIITTRKDVVGESRKRMSRKKEEIKEMVDEWSRNFSIICEYKRKSAMFLLLRCLFVSAMIYICIYICVCMYTSTQTEAAIYYKKYKSFYYYVAYLKDIEEKKRDEVRRWKVDWDSPVWHAHRVMRYGERKQKERRHTK